MNRIKCKARNRMYVATLDCLMMIELNGPAIKEKEAVHRLIDSAYEHWGECAQSQHPEKSSGCVGAQV